jgi:hypothetical protein
MLAITSFQAVLMVAGIAVALDLARFSWRQKQRRRAFLAGDYVQTLFYCQSGLPLWAPTRWLLRLLAPGYFEITMTGCLLLVGEPGLSLKWAELGLRRTRHRERRARLHGLAASAAATLGDQETAEHHLRAIREGWASGRNVDYAPSAVEAYALLGRLDLANEVLTAAVRQLDDFGSDELRHSAVRFLLSVGRYDEVLLLTAPACQHDSGQEKYDSPPKRRYERASGAGPHRRTMREFFNHWLVECGLDAAQQREDWDLYHSYLTVLDDLHLENCTAQIKSSCAHAFESLREGDLEQTRALLEQADGIAQAHPRDPAVKLMHSLYVSEVRQQMGEHETVLELLEGLADIKLPPLSRSFAASTAAISLEALGRTDQARVSRSAAEWLAPLAHWNNPTVYPAVVSEDDPVRQWVHRQSECE